MCSIFLLYIFFNILFVFRAFSQHAAVAFENNFLKNFPLQILGILSRKLDTNDHFTIEKGSICWYFGPCFSLIMLNPHFLSNYNHFKPCLRNEVLSYFASVFSFNFWKNLSSKSLSSLRKQCQFFRGLGWVKNKTVTFTDNRVQNILRIY